LDLTAEFAADDTTASVEAASFYRGHRSGGKSMRLRTNQWLREMVVNHGPANYYIL
jgi:hypothetical protein